MFQYENVLKEFMKYVNTFDAKDKNIAMKISHSLHTADLAGKLAKRLELEEEQVVFCKILGLLHDIGRFAQYEKTKSYNDYLSEFDHALYGVNYLFKENHIEDFAIPEKYYPILEKAIFNHNKLEIESFLSEEELFYAKFIRDVDKIDIFRQEATSFDWPYQEAMSKRVKDTFYKHQLIDSKDLKAKNDNLIMQLAFVYDINFKESFELLLDTDNLELFFSVVEVDKALESEFESVKKELRTFIEERMKDLC